jgi:hypothetical protein
MAVSHSFAGENVKYGRDEEADADSDHSDIEHLITSVGAYQTRNLSGAFSCDTQSGPSLIQIKPPQLAANPCSVTVILIAARLAELFAPHQVRLPRLGFERHPGFAL